MIFYVLAGLVCVGCVAAHMDADTAILAIGIGLATYIYAVHRTSWRMNPAYATVVLGIYLAVCVGLVAIYAVLGQHGAALVATGTAALVVWTLARVAPNGIRLMRLVFGGQNIQEN